MAQKMSTDRVDESQRLAIEVGAETRQVVIAAPGSGKTEVVSALLEYLIKENAVDPVNGLLVISFSNAAVHAAEARLRARGASPVAVQTMDSLATELLSDVSETEYTHLGFDARIALATLLLKRDRWDRIDNLEHLVVDEVQDLVGVRAELLSAIIAALPDDAGFTLLGDPAQGIYDFQTRPTPSGEFPGSRLTSNDLLLVVSAGNGVVTRTLTGQYRAISRDAQAAVRLRESALPGGDASAIEDFEASLVDLGPIEDVLDLVGSWPGTTALLTATNGQALRAAGTLRSRGVLTEIKRSTREQIAAGWIARLLGDSPTEAITRADIEKLIAERPPELDVPRIWRALRSLSGARGTEVSLTRVSSRLRSPRPLIPDLVEQTTARIVVSTVHRAKGLEFDNVILLDFPDRKWRDAQPQIDEIIRTRFVALTRARSRLARASGPDDRIVRPDIKRGSRRARWYVGGPKKWMTLGYEIGVGDIEAIFEDPSPGQSRLGQEVRAGDQVTFQLETDRSTLAIPVYVVTHDGAQIARTSRAFGEDLAARIGTLENRRRSWPGIGSAQVENVGTVASEPRPESEWRHGLYLTPVVTGFLELNWNGASE